MLKTEVDALHAWCHKAIKEHRCIGSKCMAWRWYGSPTRRKLERGEVPSFEGWKVLVDDPRSKYVEWIKVSDADRRGYCGLAGPVEMP